ncbi:MAG TPA: riboflavin synthase [Acidobacteriaceae bacterium]|nr:riboflavin synthase [Acidobacteriaceae bacterium]
MFTGLIEATGTVIGLQPTKGTPRIIVAGPAELVQRLHTGDSVAVSGVCLTALDIDSEANHFGADLAAETIARTSLSHLKAGSRVNLELPTPAGTPLGGHIVQGHVDGMGELQSLQPVVMGADSAATDWWLYLSIPENCVRYVVEKGSITVEGISLTVAKLEGNMVTIAVIPHTYTATNLRTLTAGAPLNIEVDVLAKYAERLTAAKAPEFELSLEYLIRSGY